MLPVWPLSAYSLGTSPAEWPERLMYTIPLATDGALTGPLPTMIWFHSWAPVCRS
jgi:hypothetical protein